MITVKCTYSSGDIITTRFNGTLKDAETYFLNRIFNVGTVHDDIQKCVKVEEYCEGHTGCKCSGCRELLSLNLNTSQRRG